MPSILEPLMDRILGRRKEQRHARISTYRETVARLATLPEDADVDEETVAQLDDMLRADGRSEDDLRQDIETARMRRKHVAKLRELPALSKAQEAADRDRAAEVERFAALHRAHVAKLAPLDERCRLAEAAVAAVATARWELNRLPVDQLLAERAAALMTEKRSTADAMARTESHIRSLGIDLVKAEKTLQIVEGKSQSKHPKVIAEVARWKDAGERIQRQQADSERRLAPLRDRLAEIERGLDAIAAEKLS